MDIKTVLIILLLSFSFGAILLYMFFQWLEYGHVDCQKIRADVTKVELEHAKMPVLGNLFGLSGDSSIILPMSAQYMDIDFYHIEARAEYLLGRTIEYSGNVDLTVFNKAKSGKIDIRFKVVFLSGKIKVCGVE